MESVGHSSLLKFFVKDTNMSETANIKSEVPGEHNIREDNESLIPNQNEPLSLDGKGQSSKEDVADIQPLDIGMTSEIASTEDYTLDPVITITKQEATFSKGDMKLQKVTVTEDISVRYQHLFKKQTTPGKTIVTTVQKLDYQISSVGGKQENINRRLTYEVHADISDSTDVEATKMDTSHVSPHKEDKEATDSRKNTKIPMARLRKTIDRVKTEMKQKRTGEKQDNTLLSYSRKSSIPRLKDCKTTPPNETSTHIKDDVSTSSKADDEFDKIFQEMSPTDDTSLDFISNIENVNQIESKFEEIIHNYEEKKTHPVNVEKVKQSKIPLLKRKSEHDIEIPADKFKSTLKKSQSFDTTKTQTNNHNRTRLSEKTRISAEEKSESFHKSKKTTEHFQTNSEDVNNVSVTIKTEATSNEINRSISRNQNAVLTQDSYVVTKTHIQNLKGGEIIETVEDLDSAFDFATTEDNVLVNDSAELIADDKEVLTQETSISESLNQYIKIDKETVSKIYKIDFTENNFDSLELSLKTDDVTKGIETPVEFLDENQNIETNDAISNFQIDVSLPNDTITETKVTLSNQETSTSTKILNNHFEEQVITSNSSFKQDISESTNLRATTRLESKYLYEKQETTDESKEITAAPAETVFENITKATIPITTNIDLSSHDSHITSDSNEQTTEASIKDNLNNAKREIILHDGHEDKSKIYSEVFSKISATQNKQFGKKEEVQVSTKIDVSKKDELNLENTMEEDIPILRGKVNRIIRRISSIDNTKDTKLDKDKFEETPNKKSILTKIAMFERDEPNEPLPKTKISKLHYEHPPTLRQTSTELRRPKVVNELLKEPSTEKPVPGTNKSSDQRNALTHHQTIIDENNFNTINSEHNQIIVKDSYSGTKLGESNYKCVKDAVNEIETIKTAEYNNFVKFKKNEENTTQRNSIKNTNILDSQKINEITGIENNVFDNQSISQIEVTHNGKNKYISEIGSYVKIYRNNDADNVTTRKYVTMPSVNLRYGNQHEEFMEKTVESNFNTSNAKSIDVISYKNDSHSTKIKIEEPEESVVVDNISVTEISLGPNINSQSLRSNDVCKSETIEKYKKDEYSRLKTREELRSKRMTSVVELDLCDAIKGKVQEMVMRINNMERIEQKKKEFINAKEKPRKRSVSEKIALFEGKLSSAKADERTESPLTMTSRSESVLDSETEKIYERKIEELSKAKKIYGSVDASYLELSDSSKMPSLALGTALLDKRIIRHVVEAAIDMGYRAIDTAYIYGNEREVGEAINNKINDGTVKREDLFITSKLWSTYHQRGLVEKACRNSLSAMCLNYFDLYLIHNPMSLLEGGDPLPKVANVLQFSKNDYMDAWYGIEDLIRKGLVRSGGVSNFNSKQVQRVVQKAVIKPVVNQVECHPYLSQQRLEDVCNAYGIKLSCYGVLGSKGTPAELKSTLAPVIDDSLVIVMAAGLEITPGQLLVAYQLHNNRSVIVKSSSGAHLHENLLAQHVTLLPSHLTALDTLNRNKRTYTFKGLGETHKNYPFNIPF
ncbi:uncharacterized protein [Battus philenor]|uniref:uncharacterized protein n=1 Tax=Battus philenor TaxID=42288 RepID=UPI0035D07B3E